MALIKLSPEQIIQYGADIAGMAGQAQQLLGDIKNHVNTISGVWDGLAHNAYLQQYAELAKQIEPLPQVVQGIGEKAKAGGETMAELERQLAKANTMG